MSSPPPETPTDTVTSTSVSTPGESPTPTPSSSSTPGETPTSVSSSTSQLPLTPSSSILPPSPTPTPTSTPPPSQLLTPSETQSTFFSVSNGNTIVITTVIRSTPTSTAVVNSNSNKGFFDNTGAVAGTFSAVGLVGLGILIFLVTTIIRRRRAEKFDKDVALAAAEAAATAHNPDFDDDYAYGSSGHGVGSYGYADTYHQDPVKFPPTREAYGMADIGTTPYAETDNYSVGVGGGPGAAGIGAGVLYRSKSGKNQPDPFNAYAIHHDPTTPQHQANLRYRNPAQGRWEDPSLAGGAYDVTRNIPQTHPDNGVARKKSIQSNNPDPSLSSHYSTDPLTQEPHAQPPPMPESYLDHYRTGFDPETHQPQMRPLSTASMADAYDGVAPGKPLGQGSHQPGKSLDFPNPFANRTSGDHRLSASSDYSEGPHPGFGLDDSRMSLRDDEDYGAGRRVLKVANE